MKFRDFGSTGFKASEVGMGCWAIGGNQFGNSYGTTDDVVSIKAIKKALESGCNFFDTADVYGNGHSEELLGMALKKVRKKVFIATKVGGAYMYGTDWGSLNFTEDYIRFAVEKSLMRLKTDYIDLYQLHTPSIQIIKDGNCFKTLRKLQEEGKIKHVGISVHKLDDGIAALDHVDSIQCVFNMLDPRNYELIEAAKIKGVAIIAREPLCNGFLTGKYNKQSTFEEGDIRARLPKSYTEGVINAVDGLKKLLVHRKEPLSQLAIKYVLSSKSVSVVIPGAKTPEQVEQNIKSSDIQELTENDLRVLGS